MAVVIYVLRPCCSVGNLRGFRSVPGDLKWLLIALIFAVASVSLYLTQRSQSSLEKFRRRIDCCREYFHKPMQLILSESSPDSPKLPFDKFCYAAIGLNTLYSYHLPFFTEIAAPGVRPCNEGGELAIISQVRKKR